MHFADKMFSYECLFVSSHLWKYGLCFEPKHIIVLLTKTHYK